jgi:hypothetical protein
MPAPAADRVKQASFSTGTGPMVLTGTAAGFKTFLQAFPGPGSVDVGAVCIVMGSYWEVSRCSYAPDTQTLTRVTCEASSNADAFVNFPAGQKSVFSVFSAAGIAELATSTDLADYTPTSGLAAVALSNEYGDLSNKPEISAAVAAGEPALRLLDGEEGIAFNFAKQSYAINDYSGVLSAMGRPGDILTVSRASSATYVGRDRLLHTASSNVLRYTYDPTTGEPLGLLTEGARTNICLRSEDFNTTWSKTNVTVTSDSTTAPDGSSNGDLATVGTAGGTISQTVSISAATTYTFSIFCKKSVGNFCRIRVNNGSDAIAAFFDISTGALGTVSTANGGFSGGAATITAYADGWYRVTYSFAHSSGGSTTVYLFSAQANNVGSAVSDATYWFGAQLEAGAHASSYIATTSSSATRAADSVSLATSAFPFSATQGAMYGAFRLDETANPALTQRIAVLQNAGATDLAFMFVDTAGAASAQIFASSVQQASLSLGAASDNATFKSGISWRKDDVVSDSSLASAATDTSATIPASLTALWFGRNSGGVNMAGTIKELVVLNRRITATELAAYTG